NDGLHYREPIPDYRIVGASEDGWLPPPKGTTALRMPAIVQGQGFENIGDETLFWYSPWPEHNSQGIRVATWGRDRLGFFTSIWGPGKDPHCISAPIDLEGKPARVSLNLDGASEHAQARVRILDEEFRELPAYSAENCTPIAAPGFRTPVRWR